VSTTIAAHNSLLRRFAGAGRGPLPEDVLEAAFFETCGQARREECTALRASWLHDYPRSERRREAVAQMSVPGVTPRVVEQIASLFGTAGQGARNGPDGEVPLPRAIRATNQYVNFYHYAVPFDAAVIEEAWRKCVGKACQDGGRRAAERLGFEVGPSAARPR